MECAIRTRPPNPLIPRPDDGQLRRGRRLVRVSAPDCASPAAGHPYVTGSGHHLFVAGQVTTAASTFHLGPGGWVPPPRGRVGRWRSAGSAWLEPGVVGGTASPVSHAGRERRG